MDKQNGLYPAGVRKFHASLKYQNNQHNLNANLTVVEQSTVYAVNSSLSKHILAQKQIIT